MPDGDQKTKPKPPIAYAVQLAEFALLMALFAFIIYTFAQPSLWT